MHKGKLMLLKKIESGLAYGARKLSYIHWEHAAEKMTYLNCQFGNIKKDIKWLNTKLSLIRRLN